MGAADLLRQVLAAGFQLRVADDKLLVSPASALTDGLRDALRACKPELIELLVGSPGRQEVAVGQSCADCKHFGRRGTCDEPVSAGLLTAEEGFGLVWPPEGQGSACPAFTGKMPAAAVDRAHGLTSGEVGMCHATGRDDAEIADIAASIKVEALRKLGEMLKAAPKATGKAGPGRGKAGAEAGPAFGDAPTLDELGLTKKESAFAQKLAELPEAAFQVVLDGHITVAKAIAAVEAARKPAPTTPPAAPAAPAASSKSAPPPEEEDEGPSAEELAAARREDADDQKRLQLLLDADEPLAAANTRIKEQAAQIRILEERVRGLTNECAAAIRLTKSWRTKFEKLERTGVAA